MAIASLFCRYVMAKLSCCHLTCPQQVAIFYIRALILLSCYTRAHLDMDAISFSMVFGRKVPASCTCHHDFVDYDSLIISLLTIAAYYYEFTAEGKCRSENHVKNIKPNSSTKYCTVHTTRSRAQPTGTDTFVSKSKAYLDNRGADCSLCT